MLNQASQRARGLHQPADLCPMSVSLQFRFYRLASRYELYQPLNKLWLSYVARLLRYRNFEEQLLQVRGLISHPVYQR